MSTKKNFTLKNKERVQHTFQSLQSSYHFAEIPRDLIRPNEMNKGFSQKKIDELKNSILANSVGLVHNLRVVYESQTNTYRLISGERRYRAIMSMTEEEYNLKFPTGIPAMVINESDINEIDEEIALIEANALTRSAEEGISTKHFERLYDLYKLKSADSEESVNMLNLLAGKLNMSPSTVQRVKNVVDTEPEIRELYDDKKLSLVTAEKLVQVNPTGQKIAAQLVEDTGNLTKEQIDALKQQYPQSRKERQQRKKGAITNTESLSQEELSEKVKELKKIVSIPETKKILDLLNTLYSKREEYDKTALEHDIEEIRNRLNLLN